MGGKEEGRLRRAQILERRDLDDETVGSYPREVLKSVTQSIYMCEQNGGGKVGLR
jgi:hypothetical protein